MNSRGFVISFDAILALFVIFAFLIASFSLIAGIDETSYNRLFLKNFSLDVLTVLEKSGKLASAASSEDTEPLDSFLNRLPFSYCARIDILEQGSSQIFLTASRASCTNPPQNSFLARRFFSAKTGNATIYYNAELRAWISGD
ncbi:MAG: hypothetical protein Q7R70_01820 [Candidatus Diapherotrites archaeon]|nr:hypothetical protein [Candidatus Diapherotrites archaeon]